MSLPTAVMIEGSVVRARAGQAAAVAQEAAHQLGREVLGVRGGAAVAEGEHLAAGAQRLRHAPADLDQERRALREEALLEGRALRGDGADAVLIHAAGIIRRLRCHRDGRDADRPLQRGPDVDGAGGSTSTPGSSTATWKTVPSRDALAGCAAAPGSAARPCPRRRSGRSRTRSRPCLRRTGSSWRGARRAAARRRAAASVGSEQDLAAQAARAAPAAAGRPRRGCARTTRRAARRGRSAARLSS